MKLSPQRVEQTLGQFDARVIPDAHPSIPQIKSVWGDHTYFLSGEGLSIVEPIEASNSGASAGKVVNVASWTDENATSLVPHEPEWTDLVVEFTSE